MTEQTKTETIGEVDTGAEVDEFFNEDADTGATVDSTTKETTAVPGSEETAESVGSSGPSAEAKADPEPPPKGDESPADEGGVTTADSADDVSRDDAVPTFSPELLKQAADAGLSEAAAKAFPDINSLVATITHIGQATGAARPTGEADAASRDGKDAPTTKAGADDSGKTPVVDWDTVRAELGDDAANTIKSISDAADSRVKELEARLGQFEQADTERRTNAIVDEYDQQFERLDNKDLFGSGSSRALDESSPEFQRRLEFMQFTEPYADNLRKARGKGVTANEIIDSAYKALHPSQESKTITSAVKKSLRTRASGVVPRNTGKTSSPEPGRDAALAEMQEIMGNAE